MNEAVLSETEIRLADAILTVGDVRVSAEASAEATREAEAASKNAINASSTALTDATKAKDEADSYARDIASAKQEAAIAVSKLADAEQRLVDSNQREAAAEAKLSAIKTPRSLIRTEQIVTALKPFEGTEFTLNVFADNESIEFTKIVASALKSAGWIRKQPKIANLGIPTISTTFDADTAENVPTCVDSGIEIRVWEKEPLAELQSMPVASLPKTLQTALVLHNVLAQTISPPDEQNVTKVMVDPKPSEEKTMVICVGKKP